MEDGMLKACGSETGVRDPELGPGWCPLARHVVHYVRPAGPLAAWHPPAASPRSTYALLFISSSPKG